ncbi:hypothetical protein AX14_010514 [Amanita brunnescens Koide BX004]|nr:hypothetical protein AX14_010514 [Amanita brunnescens Koide BX004]
MNNILVHFGNGANVTAAHDIAADLVTKCYRNLTPWWADGSEEEGLPIGEVNEKGFLADKEEVDFAGEVDIFYDIDLGGDDPLNGGKGAKRDVMFNLDAQIANNVPGDNGGIRCCDKEWDGDSEKDSGGYQWHGIGSRCHSEHTGDGPRNEEESIDSIVAGTWARFAKKWRKRVWRDDVTCYNDWQIDRLVHVGAFKESFWNSEGVWTGHWQISDKKGLDTLRLSLRFFWDIAEARDGSGLDSGDKGAGFDFLNAINFHSFLSPSVSSIVLLTFLGFSSTGDWRLAKRRSVEHWQLAAGEASVEHWRLGLATEDVLNGVLEKKTYRRIREETQSLQGWMRRALVKPSPDTFRDAAGPGSRGYEP